MQICIAPTKTKPMTFFHVLPKQLQLSLPIHLLYFAIGAVFWTGDFHLVNRQTVTVADSITLPISSVVLMRSVRAACMINDEHVYWIYPQMILIIGRSDSANAVMISIATILTCRRNYFFSSEFRSCSGDWICFLSPSESYFKNARI